MATPESSTDEVEIQMPRHEGSNSMPLVQETPDEREKRIREAEIQRLAAFRKAAPPITVPKLLHDLKFPAGDFWKD
jgi:hypothetical protein